MWKPSGWHAVVPLFWSFFKISPVTFGGGYAILPLIEREIVEHRKWLDEQEMNDVFAASQSVPGAVGINSAMFVGYRVAGVKGALAALFGVMLPAFLIVLALAVLFLHMDHIPKIESAFAGIRPAIAALIVYAGWRIGKQAVVDRTTFVIAAATVVILLLFPLHPVLVIIAGALLGVGLVQVKEKWGASSRMERRGKRSSP